MLIGLVIATKPYSYDGSLTSFAVKFIDFPLDLTWQIDKAGRSQGTPSRGGHLQLGAGRLCWPLKCATALRTGIYLLAQCKVGRGFV